MKEDLFTPNCIRTFTGHYFNVSEPKEELVCIEDIAHALSHQPRFGGHLPDFYSVAQHSVLCIDFVPPQYKLEALLHDASEAYLMDIPSPVKKQLPNYKELESGIMNVIAAKFGFTMPLHEYIKDADETMLLWEWNMLMMKGKIYKPIHCWEPKFAEKTFLDTFHYLLSTHLLTAERCNEAIK